MTHIPDGIYDDLPNDEYHAAEGLSNSALQHLLVSPLTFWVNSRHHNPNWTEKTSPQMSEGTMYHTLHLEGGDEFAKQYRLAPNPDDYPNLISGKSEIQEYLVGLGLPKSGNIPDLIERIREVDTEAQIWEEIKAEAAQDPRQEVGRETWGRLHLAKQLYDSNPHVQKLIAGTRPEVSIFWTDEETGIQCKCRPDLLGAEHTVQFKTFLNSRGVPMSIAPAAQIKAFRYHIAAAHYQAGIIASGACKIADPKIWYIFMERGDSPNIEIREMETIGDDSAVYQGGADRWRYAMQLYKHCTDLFGDRMWNMPSPPRPFGDWEFPTWML